jgi:hypothetical protein
MNNTGHPVAPISHFLRANRLTRCSATFYHHSALSIWLTPRAYQRPLTLSDRECSVRLSSITTWYDGCFAAWSLTGCDTLLSPCCTPCCYAAVLSQMTAAAAMEGATEGATEEATVAAMAAAKSIVRRVATTAAAMAATMEAMMTAVTMVTTVSHVPLGRPCACRQTADRLEFLLQPTVKRSPA